MGMCGEERNGLSNKRRILRGQNKEDKYNNNIKNIIKGAESLNSSNLSNIDNQIKDSNRQKKRVIIEHDKTSINSKSSIGKIINGESNFLDRKNQNGNDKYLDNLGKEDNKKSFKNIEESQTLDNNINDDAFDDNKISQKFVNKSDNMEEEDDKKISINENQILESKDNNIYDDDHIDDKKSQNSIYNSIKKESNYSNFDINKYYFFTCPLCLNAPYIESIKYDIIKEDFFVTYICKCELKERENPVSLSDLIIEKEPINSCQSHSFKELVYYCKTCEMKICIDCYKEEHKNHEVNNKEQPKCKSFN